MSNPPEVNRRRRNIVIGTAAVGGAAGVAAAIPFVDSMEPSERAKALGAPVEVDISKIAPGEQMTVEWRGRPVWVLHRTSEQIASVAKSGVVQSATKSAAFPRTARYSGR